MEIVKSMLQTRSTARDFHLPLAPSWLTRLVVNATARGCHRLVRWEDRKARDTRIFFVEALSLQAWHESFERVAILVAVLSPFCCEAPLQT